MKYLIVILLVIFSFKSFAQATDQSVYPVGNSEDAIRNEFVDFNFQTNHTKDGIKFIFATDQSNTLTFYYYFNKADTCYRYVVVPLKPDALNNLIQQYNKDYVIVNDKEWKKNIPNGKVMDVQLICPDVNGCFFLYQ